MDFSMEAFINEIHKRPSIWDSNNEDYSNKFAKASDWEDVFVTFTPNYNEKTAAEKNSIAAGMHRKWKSLRNSYSRELVRKKKEKSRGPTGRKQYIYYDHLRFLDSVVKLNNVSTTQNDEDEETSTDNIQEAFVEVKVENDAPVIREIKRKASIDIEENEVDFQTYKRKDHEPKDETNDEDRLFMLSLVPELKRLPDFLKLETKCELMNVIKKARQQCLPNSSVEWALHSFS